MGKSVLMKVAFFSVLLVGCLMLFVSAKEEIMKEIAATEIEMEEVEISLLRKAINFLWKSGQNSYTHVWPEMEFGWEIIVGSLIGFFGAAFGSVGGVGGGGIYVPMLTLIIGFDSKSSTAISKCMIMGAAASTVYYNLKQRHPTLDMPVIDYDLALLFQPVLVLGISIGVAFNVIFADWMITVLLIILFLFTSTKAFLKGVDAWKKETIMKKEAAQRLLSNGDNGDYKALSAVPSKKEEVSIKENVHWPVVGVLFAVWFAILGLEIAQKYTSTCSIGYWATNLLQFPVALGASGYEAYLLYTGKRVIASRGDAVGSWKIHQLILCMCVGVCAGMVGGLLGLGGGFILGPLFLELGIPPQVSSATATFAMMFSSSMSVVEYYLLKRFPIPYAAYFVAVSTFAALAGQVLVRRLIAILGRASLIIFILSFTIFVSAISLGGVGISNMVYKIQHNEYMGFDSLCAYEV
ncbi:sulfite exporter TauE/SafE family protein 3-like [Amaranthus tricolor]|uniref:sulfite exporter TauE/SafE family protein 3-like n=1 Tax=Amaranthus tricolor TaxID=29722 RepID=UPI00258A9045|nr:sulfite exporter TauE/SafE family protein 3-like [Amaranthus tricolor]